MAGHGRVRRLRGSEAALGDHSGMGSGWVRGFVVSLRQNDVRSSEQLAHEMFEGAPGPVRHMLVAGWRLVLGLRLLPGTADRSVLGWAVTSSTHDEVVLAAESRLLAAVKVIRRVDPDLIATTSVRYESAWGRAVWAVVLPFHLLIEPRLLARAARSPHTTRRRARRPDSAQNDEDLAFLDHVAR